MKKFLLSSFIAGASLISASVFACTPPGSLNYTFSPGQQECVGSLATFGATVQCTTNTTSGNTLQVVSSSDNLYYSYDGATLNKVTPGVKLQAQKGSGIIYLKDASPTGGGNALLKDVQGNSTLSINCQFIG